MIIKVIPETDAEKARLKEVTHEHVNEFFMFGNRQDGDGDLVDFHDWTGSYRYLIGSLYYFTKGIEAEELSNKSGGVQVPVQLSAPKPQAKMLKFGDGQQPPLEGPMTAPVEPEAPIETAEEAVAELGIDNANPQLTLVKDEMPSAKDTE